MRVLLITGGLFTLSVSAVAGDFGASAKMGTLGLGVEVSKSVPFNITGRLGINGFNYDYNDTVSGVGYESDLNLKSVSALMDWRPIGSLFRLTGGMLYNMNEVDASSTPANTYDIGGSTFTAQQVGTITGNVEFDDYAPYFGLGFNFPVAPTFKVTFDLGVMFQGTPDVSLSASGPIASDPTFQQELTTEEQAFQDDLDNFEYYPVITLGLRKSF